MNQTTRQRITGTLVLVVAALVLLPVIFDGEGSYQPSVQPNIPVRPSQPQAALQDPQRPIITADSDAIRIRPESGISDSSAAIVSSSTSSTPPTSVPAQSNSTSAQVSPPPTQPAVTAAPARTATLDVQGLPEAWSVRLGSFSNTDNASKLLARLLADGHRAYTRRVETSQGTLTAVFVGPQVDRTAAQHLMERLRQDFELTGMIVRYEIEEL